MKLCTTELETEPQMHGTYVVITKAHFITLYFDLKWLHTVMRLSQMES